MFIAADALRTKLRRSDMLNSQLLDHSKNASTCRSQRSLYLCDVRL